MAPIPAPDERPIPDDDPSRALTRRRVDDPDAQVVQMVGDTYTILVSGSHTGGQFTLIDMVVPPGGGPLPHRHDFEETFTLLEGRVEVTFRGETVTIGAGDTVNVPSNAPHHFRNAGDVDAHMHCICSPAGQDEFFLRAAAGEDPGGLIARYRSELVTE